MSCIFLDFSMMKAYNDIHFWTYEENDCSSPPLSFLVENDDCRLIHDAVYTYTCEHKLLDDHEMTELVLFESLSSRRGQTQTVTNTQCP